VTPATITELEREAAELQALLDTQARTEKAERRLLEVHEAMHRAAAERETERVTAAHEYREARAAYVAARDRAFEALAEATRAQASARVCRQAMEGCHAICIKLGITDIEPKAPSAQYMAAALTGAELRRVMQDAQAAAATDF
jgi:hypothetical protein